MTEVEKFDVLIVGAGISGIGAGCHLRTHCPQERFAILEARDDIGGTWDLFKYPGIRSDSDMYTFGYGFRPWRGSRAIAQGADILAYLSDVVDEYALRSQIRFGTRVTSLRWSSKEACWHVSATQNGSEVVYQAAVIMMCSGYYRYDKGYTPDIPGLDDFEGRLVHPQHWDDVAHEDKRVVIVGSGATAITLLPVLAKAAAHVTMLQRSPTYVVAMPAEDALAEKLERWLPPTSAGRAIRAKNIAYGMWTYSVAKALPTLVKKEIKRLTHEELPDSVDVEAHFTPNYDPWDQRLCIAPDGDFFAALREGSASVVTDQIQKVVANGIELKSGEFLPADLLVTATGLAVQFLGGAEVLIDDAPIHPKDTMTFRGVMLSSVPNFFFAAGYTNASWTLKVDLACRYACRVINAMRDKGAQSVVAVRDPNVAETPLLDLSSGYVQRAKDILPHNGDKLPWKLYQNYVLDWFLMRRSPDKDSSLRFF